MKHLTFHDGGRAEIEDDGRWNLTLPTGKHVRGTAADVAAAEQAIDAERTVFILRCWNAGSFGRRSGTFECPLNPK